MKRYQIVTVVLAFGFASTVAWWLAPRTPADRHREQERRNLNPALWWTTPISFYGRIVDQYGDPVPQADVKFHINDTSAAGTSEYHANTDANGFFSIGGVKGKHLSVHIAKRGYYQSGAEKSNFEYAGAGDIYEPDPKNPTVFHLHKGGEKVPLIKKELNAHIKLGETVVVDLLNGTTDSANGQLRIELLENDPGGRNAFGAKCRMRLSVADGGIQTNAKEFPFFAPESGYESSVEIGTEFGTSRPGWGTTTARAVFLKMTGLYARAQIELNPGGSQFLVDYYVNPTGSRDLEPDPTVYLEDLESYNRYIAAHPQTAK